MIDRYITFNINEFLMESKEWGKKKIKLQRELDAISYQPSSTNETGIRGSDPKSTVEITAEKEMKIQSEISDIERKEEMLAYAFSVLEEREKEIVREMAYSARRKGVIVWEYGRKYGLGKDYVYRERNTALAKMSNAIMEKYYRAE